MLADRPSHEIAQRLLQYLFKHGPTDTLRAQLTDLGKTMSPHELKALYVSITEMTTPEGCQAFAKLAPMWSMFLNGAGKVYRREKLFESSLLFRSAVKGQRRAAIVCFTSRANGMFMPNARFLELLGDYAVDVVFNMTETGTFGLWRIGRAKSFAESLAVLKRVLAARGIVPRAYVGASAGGGPAVYAAALDPGTRAVIFAGRMYRPGRSIKLEDAGTAFEPVCACWQGNKPQVYSIFAAGNSRDAADDTRFRALLPATKSYPLPNDDKHGPMATLTARRKIKHTMDLMVQVARGIDVNFDEVLQK